MASLGETLLARFPLVCCKLRLTRSYRRKEGGRLMQHWSQSYPSGLVCLTIRIWLA